MVTSAPGQPRQMAYRTLSLVVKRMSRAVKPAMSFSLTGHAGLHRVGPSPWRVQLVVP